MNSREIPPYEAFQNNLRNCNPLEKEYVDYEKPTCSGLATDSVLVRMRFSDKPPTGAENFSIGRNCGSWKNAVIQSLFALVH